MSRKRTTISRLRERIDTIDADIVGLLNDRIRTAIEIGRAKQASDSEVYVPAREQEVFERVQKLNKGPLATEALKAIYREIMSASLATEKAVKVAYLGPLGTHSHAAARGKFGASVEYVACESISDVFRTVEKRGADYGVVPIENSIQGAEPPTLDSLASTRLKICAELLHPVSNCLLSRSPREKIRKIYSHPQPLAQCTRWLRMEMPGIDQVPASSTAKAAEMAAVEHGSAAIANSLAAEIYKLNIIAQGIEDVSGNETRFLVIGRKFGHTTGRDRTSIIFTVRHSAGSLFSALEAFKRYKLNMTKIESRPSRTKAWEYVFFVDLEGHPEDPQVARALVSLGRHCTMLNVLGAYPRAD